LQAPPSSGAFCLCVRSPGWTGFRPGPVRPWGFVGRSSAPPGQQDPRFVCHHAVSRESTSRGAKSTFVGFWIFVDI
jgi:hypothetical protein